jgi:transposase InsO family protein
VRETPAQWRREYNCERSHSSLDYRTSEEFRQKTGCADVESKERFPHPHSLDDGKAKTGKL